MTVGGRRLLIGTLVLLLGVVVFIIGQGLIRLYWHDHQLKELAVAMSEAAALPPTDRPLWVVTELASTGATLSEVENSLAPLEPFVGDEQWFADSSRVVQRLQFRVPRSFDEPVFLEYRAGRLSYIDGGDYPQLGLRAVDEDSARHRINTAARGMTGQHGV